jgi:hypothetical protein
VPEVEKIRGLNLPGTPWAASACRGIPFLFYFLLLLLLLSNLLLSDKEALQLCSLFCNLFILFLSSEGASDHKILIVAVLQQGKDSLTE